MSIWQHSVATLMFMMLVSASPAGLARASDSTAVSPDTLRLSMEGAVKLFLQRNPAVRAAQYHIISSEADIVAARMFPNPQLSVNASSIDISRKPVDYSLTQSAYRIDQAVDVFGKRGPRIESAEHAFSSAKADIQYSLRQAQADFREAYFAVIFARRQEELARSRRALFDTTLISSGIRFRSGDISEADLMKLQLTELDFRQAESDAAQALTDAMAALRQMLNLGPPVPLEVVDTFQPELVLPPFDSLMTVAMAARLDLTSQRERRMAQESRMHAAARGAWPDLSLGVELDREGPEFRNLVGGGVSISLPLFSRNQDEIQRAEADLEAATLDEQGKTNAVANSVSAAYDRYRMSLDIIRSLSTETVRNANQVRDLSARSFQRGAISLVDYLETERIVNDAITSYNTALSKFVINQIELERAVGTNLFEEESQ